MKNVSELIWFFQATVLHMLLDIIVEIRLSLDISDWK